MTKRKTETYRRLTHNKNGNTWLLTIPKEVIDSNSWAKGQTLFLRNKDGILYYKEKEDELARKLRLQYSKSNRTWSIRVPYRLVERYGWKPHQEFSFLSGKGIIKFNPFLYDGSTMLNGVAKPKKTGFNLPKKIIEENIKECINRVVTENEATN
jgi:hypothetical protein